MDHGHESITGGNPDDIGYDPDNTGFEADVPDAGPLEGRDWVYDDTSADDDVRQQQKVSKAALAKEEEKQARRRKPAALPPSLKVNVAEGRALVEAIAAKHGFDSSDDVYEHLRNEIAKLEVGEEFSTSTVDDILDLLRAQARA